MAQQVKSEINKAIKFVKTSRIQKYLLVIFLVIIIFNFFSVIFQQRMSYFRFDYSQRAAAYKKIYYDSIYKNKHGIWLSDEVLYSYIGVALVGGANPILLNPEVPPFGTYLIGISTVIFQNEHINSAIFASFALLMMFLIGRQVYGNPVAALIPPMLLTFEPIFKNQLIYTPLLDIIQLFFLLMIIYFFNKSMTKTKYGRYFVLVSILLGFFISTKFFATGFAVVGALVSTMFINFDKKRLFSLLASLPIAVFVLYATYFKVLIDGYPINKFLGIQKWIFLYNEGHLVQPFSIWPLLLFNQWHTWFGKIPVISDSQWSVTWPLITVLSLLTIFLYFFVLKTKKKEIEVLFSWVVIYLLLMSFVQISSRYFVILIPILYMVVVYGIRECFKHSFHLEHKNKK